MLIIDINKFNKFHNFGLIWSKVRFSGPVYLALGLISELFDLYSKIWADQPVNLEITKIGVNKLIGIYK